LNKIIQITDLHLTKPGTRLWGIDPCSRLEACLNDLAQHHADADFCVISGDLTEAGDPEALRYLQKKLDNFPIDTHLMIGNHDNRERFLSTFPDQPTDGNGFIQYAIQTSFGRFIFLDTKKDEPTSAGHLCRQRIDWLADELEQYIGDVFIFMHHPPCDVGVAYMDRIKLDNQFLPRRCHKTGISGTNI
jgi:Icc protein